MEKILIGVCFILVSFFINRYLNKKYEKIDKYDLPHRFEIKLSIWGFLLIGLYSIYLGVNIFL